MIAELSRYSMWWASHPREATRCSAIICRWQSTARLAASACRPWGTSVQVVCSAGVQPRRRQHEGGHDRQPEGRVDQSEDPGLGLVEDQPVHPVAEEVSRIGGLSGPHPELLLPD